jgi:hydrogenase/urease accessory protein HupE
MRRTLACLVAAAGALAAPAAQAHLTSSGLGPWYDGVLHLLMTPGDLLLVIALALFAGLRGADSGRALLFALPGAWLAGGLCGLNFASELELPVETTLALIAVGLLVATSAPLPRSATLTLALAVGAVQGAQNGSAVAVSGGGLSTLLGIVSAGFVIVALVAALACVQREGWRRIALRVAGSWIAAIGLLTLGWAMRGAG